jgi:hypothetical protein
MRTASPHLTAAVLMMGLASAAHADMRREARVIVLRSAAADVEFTQAVDRALVSSLSDDAGFGVAELSPIPLGDLGLAAGCDDRSRRCLDRIAAAVGADIVVIRDLRGQESGSPVLALTSFDALGAGAPIHLERPLEGHADTEVPEMVRQLYTLDPDAAGPSRVVVVHPSGEVTPGRTMPSDEPDVSPVTWVTLGTGGAVLAGAAVVGVLARSARDDYAKTAIRSDADADRASELLETAQSRSLAANLLFGAGGALLAVGAALLVVDLARAEPDSPVLGASAAPDGAMVWLRSTTGAW